MHAVRVSAAHGGTDAFDSCCRAGLWSGAASLRSLQPARWGTSGPLAAKTRDDHLYARPFAVRGEHSPDAAPSQRTTAVASALQHCLEPGNDLALLPDGRAGGARVGRATESAHHGSGTERVGL